MPEREITEILKEQQNLLAKISEVLKEEYELLKNRRALDLPKLTESKSEILLKIQTNDRSLKNHSARERLKGDLAPMKEQILKALAEVQQQNDVNGRLIELNLAANRRLASSLIQIRDTSTMTYDGKGKQNAIQGGHISFDA